jgi:putative glutamine amidotransferase
MKLPITIGITDCRKYDNYANWFKHDPSIRVVRLSWVEKNYRDIEQCDGLVLSGGEDVHPRFYGKPEYMELLDPAFVIEQRDEFELKIIEEALKRDLPLLGICRGLQVANVYFKGTLVPDLPSIGKVGHAMENGIDQRHPVQVSPGSVLAELVHGNRGEVNSAHHQVADRVADVLRVNALSADGVIEGLERKPNSPIPYTLLVQWHPERMTDPDNPFSNNIREGFLQEVRKVAVVPKP